MRILCGANGGRALSKSRFEEGYTPSSKFDLEVGKEYIVYGISLWKGALLYLLVGEGRFPHWYPSELFSVTRKELPSVWFFTSFKEEGYDLKAIWGYDELVNTDEHFDDLANLSKGAIDIFVEQKKWIDEAS